MDLHIFAVRISSGMRKDLEYVMPAYILDGVHNASQTPTYTYFFPRPLSDAELDRISLRARRLGAESLKFEAASQDYLQQALRRFNKLKA